MNYKSTGHKRNQIVHTKESLNQETGEITTEQTSYQYDTKLPTEPAFIKLYLEDVLYLKGLQTTQSDLLLALLRQMNYQNQIVLNAAIKRIIAKEINMAIGTIDNNLTNFVKKHILFRIDRGVYTANPNLFGKGEWKNIYQLRMEIEYGEGGRKLNLNSIIKKEDEKAKELAQAKESANSEKATLLVEDAEMTKLKSDIEIAKKAIRQVSNASLRKALHYRLNCIIEEGLEEAIEVEETSVTELKQEGEAS